MFRILMSPTHGWLIQDSKTGLETTYWQTSLREACNAERNDHFSPDEYCVAKGVVTLLCTDVQPTWDYLQKHHPELLI